MPQKDNLYSYQKTQIFYSAQLSDPNSDEYSSQYFKSNTFKYNTNVYDSKSFEYNRNTYTGLKLLQEKQLDKTTLLMGLTSVVARPTEIDDFSNVKLLFNVIVAGLVTLSMMFHLFCKCVHAVAVKAFYQLKVLGKRLLIYGCYILLPLKLLLSLTTASAGLFGPILANKQLYNPILFLVDVSGLSYCSKMIFYAFRNCVTEHGEQNYQQKATAKKYRKASLIFEYEDDSNMKYRIVNFKDQISQQNFSLQNLFLIFQSAAAFLKRRLRFIKQMLMSVIARFFYNLFF